MAIHIQALQACIQKNKLPIIDFINTPYEVIDNLRESVIQTLKITTGARSFYTEHKTRTIRMTWNPADILTEGTQIF